MITADKIVSRLKQTSLFKKVVLSILLFILLLICCLSIVVATQSGTRWVVTSITNMLDIRLTNLQGNLLTGLDVAHVDYKKAELSVHAEKISFRWQPFALLYASVSIQSFSAENILIHLPASKNEPEPDNYQWPNFSQPVRVELEKIKIRNVVIEQPDSQFPISAIDGSLTLGNFRLSAKDLHVANSQVDLLTNGSISLHYPYKLSIKNAWQFTSAGATGVEYAGEITLGGSIKELQVTHGLSIPYALKTTGKVLPALHEKNKNPYAELSNEWSEQKLPEQLLQKINPEGKIYFLNRLQTVQGRVTAKGWLNAYQFEGNVLTKTLDADLLLDVHGTGDYASNKDANSQSVSSANIHLDKLQVSAKESSLTDSLLTATPITSTQKKPFLENSLLISGDIGILPELQWNLDLQGEHIDLGQFIENWPSDLQANITSQGKLLTHSAQSAESVWQLDVNHIDIHGVLREFNVLTQGEIHFDGTHWKSSALNAAVGDNKLSLKGQAGNDLALEWKINAPKLDQIDPALRGAILSDGVVSGEVSQPHLQVNAQATQLTWGDYSVESLQININPLSQKMQTDYNFLLDAKNIRIASQFISHVSLSGAGSIVQHKILGKIESTDYGVLQFGLDSGWKDNTWKGKWNSFSVDAQKIPRWNMLSATAMQANKTSIDLGKLCLTTTNEISAEIAQTSAGAQPLQEQPAICLTGKWDVNSGSVANIHLNAVPLSSARAWFKPEVILAGVVDGECNVRAANTKPLVIDANLQTRAAELRYQFPNGNVESYSLVKGSANLALNNNLLTTSFMMDWAKYGVLNGDGKYSLTDKKIQAKATASLPDIAPLEGLLPFLNNVKGSAAGNVNIAGTVEKPEITGNFSLKNGSANFPRLGLDLKNISYDITSPSVNSAHVEGRITSGDGTLVTQGDFINLGAPDWHWQANVFGADIRIVQQTQLTANFSPNLHLTANAQSIELTGSTEIPWARAVVKNLPESATRVSSDVVIVEKNKVSAETLAKKSIPFHTNIILYFGDDVRFKGFGLDTRLTGKANVLKEENRQMFTTGFVAVDKGVYKAYGQELNIERGRLIFQGPYDNPGLDIRALRVTETDTAGLDIGGTLQHPKSTVFAIPARPDSEAMAILLTGKSLSQSSKEDAYSIIGAIGKLGMNQGDSMTADIAHKVGLDEVGFTTSDEGLNQSALSVGKYITPKLFIRYIVGLFDQAFSIGVTYKINDKVHLEAESGKIQSFDIMYKIER